MKKLLNKTDFNNEKDTKIILKAFYFSAHFNS